MNRRFGAPALAMLALLAGLAASFAQAAGPYYARGDYYAGSAGLWSNDSGNQLFDDGLHGDGGAGDGVYGAWVVSDQPPGSHGFKIANADWSELWPHNPDASLDNGRLLTTTDGETIHFRLDLNALPGWQPVWGAAACDHGMPAGATMEVMGSAPELGAWATPVPAVDDAGIWTAVVHLATPGDHEFKFRVAGTWDWPFGAMYNLGSGVNFTFTTTVPGTAVRLRFNPLDGRGTAAEFDETPVRSTTWGRLKSLRR